MNRAVVCLAELPLFAVWMVGYSASPYLLLMPPSTKPEAVVEIVSCLATSFLSTDPSRSVFHTGHGCFCMLGLAIAGLWTGLLIEFSTGQLSGPHPGLPSIGLLPPLYSFFFSTPSVSIRFLLSR